MKNETTFSRLKKGLLELLRGYPSYRFFGKIEYYLGHGEFSLDVLSRDEIIELASREEAERLNKKLTREQWIQLRAEGKKEPIWYRLTSKGVDLAISMINLEYAREMRIFTKIIILLTILTSFFAFEQIFLLIFFG